MHSKTRKQKKINKKGGGIKIKDNLALKNYKKKN